MVVLVLVALGIVGVCRIPVSLIPDVDIPCFTLQVNDRTKSARELDESVVQHLRQSLEQINHLKEIKSESRDGSAIITLNFEEGQNVDYLFIEVNEKVDHALSSLPKMERPKIFKANATDIPAFYINITLKDDEDVTAGDPTHYPVSNRFRQMSRFATDVIAKRIEQLPEVAMVDISGTTSDEILVIPDEDALHKIGLSLPEFEDCIASANIKLSNLTIRDGEYQYNVKFQSFANKADDIADVYFKAGGRIMQIKEVAHVIEHPSQRSGLVTSNGKDAVVFAVIKQSDAKMANLRSSINRQMKEFAFDYPELDFEIVRDQTELLDYSIRNLFLNIIIAILLDCLVIFLFMKDLRSPLLVSLTIPVSLIVSFFVFFLIGVSINIISLSGILLGVGMMVDNSIILTDNITARWQRGESLRNAVLNGTAEVRGAMLSSVLTTCSVFIPLIFLDGLAGELFYDQAIAITVILIVSYIVTILLIPIYYWNIYRKKPAFMPSRRLARLEFHGAKGVYDKVSDWFILNRWTVWAIPAVCAVTIALCVGYMPKEKLPPITYTDAILNVDWNEHITVDENKHRISELEAAINSICCQSTALIGMQQFVLRHSRDLSAGEASLYFKCSNDSDLDTAKSMLSFLLSSSYPMAITSYTASSNVFDMIFAQKDPELVAHLRPTGSIGIEVEPLAEVLSEIQNAIPETTIASIPMKKDVVYVANPELMALYGVSFDALRVTLTNAMNGNRIFEIVQGNYSVPVVMGMDVRDMEDILNKTQISIRQEDGTITDIPISAIMRQSWGQDLKTLVSGVEGSYYPVVLNVPAKRVKAVMARVSDVVRKNGQFEVGFDGAYFSNLDMLRHMVLVLLVAVALLFLILASQFESLIQPAIILSEIIIDIAASLAAIWILGGSINIMSLIGIVVICGIVINDSILKIDTINQLRKQGWETVSAIHEAGHRRLKSIIMTSVTTILAVAPFLSRGNMGDDLQYPMALVIIVGMTVGTFISLFFVPAFYAYIYRRRK